ncbi:BgTH12-05503 [Blumeria graminis f. sp. triticale]|uniref:BgTH12-05503 n=1 Tax=Blumeria graminis f. sp. triticale TaxID=1689686 RepID=A0A9W4D409_BLUGR|nr:BgTH12-05503 [Blumeria graminis f. sp. triticale]
MATSSTPEQSIADKTKAEDSEFHPLDIFRTFVFLALISSVLSYFITRESFTWSIERPRWARTIVIKAWLMGPQNYSDDDLKAFNGTDPSKPILLAINGTIYDVSPGRRFYGPGGSYHFFSGRDASRAFVSNCFDVDLTPDMRGLEEIFLPLNDPTIDSLYSSGDLKNLRQKERREAFQKVDQSLRKWVEFFANHKKYVKIGLVKRDDGWEFQGPPPPLCESAMAKRKPREGPLSRNDKN